jgi:alkanesulfonate monooxygenase SsuD/methylene tetrahydromethanopterin reductase-like flavin-dependent oxidoreductase (luciferase family)
MCDRVGRPCGQQSHAREVITVDTLTGGGLEPGLGAGQMKWEFDESGFTGPRHSERVRAVAPR